MTSKRTPMPDWNWISKSPMLDGSGVIQFGNRTFKIVVQDLVTTKHRVAFLPGGKEVARASTFLALLRKLAQLKD